MAIVQHSPGLGNGANNETGSTQIGYEHLWKLRKYLVLLGTLAVSVTYNSGLTPPGGFWYKNKDGHKAGDPALQAEFSKRYEVFFYCNATAFAASLVLIILLLSKSVTRQELWLRLMQFTMLVDLFSLMGAYAAGSCRALKSSIYTWVLVFAVFVYLWIHILVSTRVVPEKTKKGIEEGGKSNSTQIRLQCWASEQPSRERHGGGSQVYFDACNFCCYCYIPSGAESTWWLLG